MHLVRQRGYPMAAFVTNNGGLLFSKQAALAGTPASLLLSIARAKNSSLVLARLNALVSTFQPNVASRRTLSTKKSHMSSLAPTILLNVHFRQREVRRELRNLNPSKATGPDGIPAIVLKECADDLARPLSMLFSLCFRNACQPASWKIANVVPIFKKNSKSLPNNYRPVSLLPIISKIMERIINKVLTNFLEKHSVLSNRQFGFRSGLGTSDLLVSLHHQWSRTANQGGLVRVLAVDIAGAFDKVSHRGVLHKASLYGVRGRIYSWLES